MANPLGLPRQRNMPVATTRGALSPLRAILTALANGAKQLHAWPVKFSRARWHARVGGPSRRGWAYAILAQVACC
eukprot:4361346-Lingulodinium_polyedra.AAC.1